MMDELSPPPVQIAPPPVPARKRGPARSLWIFLALAVVLFYFGPLRVEVRFTDDVGHVPGPFEAVLRSDSTEEKVTVEKGRLNLLRGRWKELEITDDSYLRATHGVLRGKMNLVIERNALLKLREASGGLPSVPQHGDPDPRGDR